MSILVESEMNFLCDIQDTFFIEKYLKENNVEHVKCIEFIRRIKDNLIILVEAKTSAPNPNNCPEKFEYFIKDIIQKAIDGFSMFGSILIGTREERLPSYLFSTDYSEVQFCFILVIKKHKIEWLPEVKSILENELRHFYTAWNWGNIPVLVLNEDLAFEQGLITKS